MVDYINETIPTEDAADIAIHQYAGGDIEIAPGDLDILRSTDPNAVEAQKRVLDRLAEEYPFSAGWTAARNMAKIMKLFTDKTK